MNTVIIIPDVTTVRHILNKDSYAMKYITKDQIQKSIDLLRGCIAKAGADIVPSQAEVKSKTDLMNVYGWLYQECIRHNEAVLADRQAKPQKTPTTCERKAARLSDAEERFTRYSDELAKREAGDMMGLDARGQRHRIASLKRKIARAEASLKKLQENS